MSLLNTLIVFLMVALVYHLGPWRPGQSGGEGFDDMMEVSVANWDDEVVGESKPVLVLFYSSANVDTESVKAAVAGVQGSYRGQLKVACVDLDANASLAMRHRIERVPTLMVFHHGLQAETLAPEVSTSFNALKSSLAAYCGESF